MARSSARLAALGKKEKEEKADSKEEPVEKSTTAEKKVEDEEKTEKSAEESTVTSKEEAKEESKEEEPAKKKAKTSKAEEGKDEADVSAGKDEKKVVTIEHCKSWGAFRTRAGKIVKAVGSKARVDVNKEKPGKGNFIVTVSGVDEPIVELKGLKRPFPPLKALDMDEVIAGVMEAIGA